MSIHDKSGHLSIFTSLKHINDAFEVQIFQGFIFTPYHRHCSMPVMQLRFFFIYANIVKQCL